MPTHPYRKALLLSPHPDDEVITGLWPYRLMKECGWEIVNVAVTLGSDKTLRATRLQELKKSCAQIGFRLVLPTKSGLDNVRTGADSDERQRNVRKIARIIAREKPQIVFMPHFNDFNATHCGTHTLGVEAIKSLKMRPTIVYTEYWHPMSHPNVMVEGSVADVSEIVSALRRHASQIKRNPYDKSLGSWMTDNVRRGAEVVGGQGGTGPEMHYAVLYGLEKYDAATQRWTRANPTLKHWMVPCSTTPEAPFL